MQIDSQSLLLCKGLPADLNPDTKFDDPWEARVFAIIVQLTQDRCFEWSEWVDCFSQEVAAETAIEASGGVPRPYYEQWLNAAEKILIAKGVTNKAQLRARHFAAVSAANIMK